MRQYIAHTVDVDGTLVAGFLVRQGGAELGYIWCTGQEWGWRSLDGKAFGVRHQKMIAADTLYDVYLATSRRLGVKVTDTTDSQPRGMVNVVLGGVEWSGPAISVQRVQRPKPVKAKPLVQGDGFVMLSRTEQPSKARKRPQYQEPPPATRHVDWDAVEAAPQTDINAASLTDLVRTAINKHKRSE